MEGFIYSALYPPAREETKIDELLNITDDYKVEITDLSLSIVDKFTDDGQGVMHIGVEADEATDIFFQVGTHYYEETEDVFFVDYVQARSTSIGTHTVKLYKKQTPMPSGYTWDGVTSADDIVVEDSGMTMTFHKVADELITAQQYVGAIVKNNIDGSVITYPALTENEISDDTVGENIDITITVEDKEIGGFPSCFTCQGTTHGSIEGHTFNDVYFTKWTATGVEWFCSSLILSQ